MRMELCEVALELSECFARNSGPGNLDLWIVFVATDGGGVVSGLSIGRSVILNHGNGVKVAPMPLTGCALQL